MSDPNIESDHSVNAKTSSSNTTDLRDKNMSLFQSKKQITPLIMFTASKRRRHSSNDSDTIKPANKQPKIEKSVTFSLQNNSNGVDESTETDGAEIGAPSCSNYQVNATARATWNASKGHRTTEMKARVRADHLERMLESDTIRQKSCHATICR